MIRRAPGFARVVILTLAVAIGMNTAVFGVFNAVILRPLAYPHPDDRRRAAAGFPVPLSSDGLGGVILGLNRAYRGADGRQFVVISGGGHGVEGGMPLGDYVTAFAVPAQR
jgi:hypothetical protein